MSNTEELKNYLIDEADGFLLNPDNNGKTIMLSGAWGAGKTHFWNEDILKGEYGLLEQLGDKACVYVSLYGKDSLDSLKKEVLIKASLDREEVNEIISKEVSTFGVEALSSIKDSDLNIFKLVNAGIDLAQGMKSKKGIEKLKDGGIICFDDFERKSKEIDLNDLFGFISQLAIEYQCKVIIILNSDVFEGEEANVFKQVKEKTVNKYFHFEPTPKELFDSVANDEKYDKLNDYKEEILKAIEETEELNARIYIQVLDNCLEWTNKGYPDALLKSLVFSTVCFIKNHFLLKINIVGIKGKGHYYNDSNGISFTIMDTYPDIVYKFFDAMSDSKIKQLSMNQIISSLKQYVYDDKVNDDVISWINNNKKELEAVYKYGYKLSEKIDTKIVLFVKTGILPKLTKEVESSLPPEAVAEIKA